MSSLKILFKQEVSVSRTPPEVKKNFFLNKYYNKYFKVINTLKSPEILGVPA